MASQKHLKSGVLLCERISAASLRLCRSSPETHHEFELEENVGFILRCSFDNSARIGTRRRLFASSCARLFSDSAPHIRAQTSIGTSIGTSGEVTPTTPSSAHAKATGNSKSQQKRFFITRFSSRCTESLFTARRFKDRKLTKVPAAKQRAARLADKRIITQI